MVKNNPHGFFAAVEKAKKIIVISSLPVDPDSIGSGIAIKYWLEKTGKSVDLYIPEKPKLTDKKFNKYFKVTNLNKLDYSRYDLLLALDCSNPDQQLVDYKKYGEFILPKISVAAIDHHHGNGNYTKNIIFEETSSTSELIWRYVFRKFPIDVATATYLLRGLAADTGYFRWAMGPETLAVAQELINHGADLKSVVKETFFNNTKWLLRGISYFLSKVKYNRKLGVSYVLMTASDLQKMHLAEGKYTSVKNLYQAMFSRTVPEYPLEFIFTKFHRNDKVAVSGRSDTLRSNVFDLTQLAYKVAGVRRGHPGASGFDIPGTIPEVKKKVFTAAKEMQKEMKVKPSR